MGLVDVHIGEVRKIETADEWPCLEDPIELPKPILSGGEGEEMKEAFNSAYTCAKNFAKKKGIGNILERKEFHTQILGVRISFLFIFIAPIITCAFFVIFKKVKKSEKCNLHLIKKIIKIIRQKSGRVKKE